MQNDKPLLHKCAFALTVTSQKNRHCFSAQKITFIERVNEVWIILDRQIYIVEIYWMMWQAITLTQTQGFNTCTWNLLLLALNQIRNKTAPNSTEVTETVKCVTQYITLLRLDCLRIMTAVMLRRQCLHICFHITLCENSVFTSLSFVMWEKWRLRKGPSCWGRSCSTMSTMHVHM